MRRSETLVGLALVALAVAAARYGTSVLTVALAQAPLFFYLPGALLVGTACRRVDLGTVARTGAIVTVSVAVSGLLAELVEGLGLALDLLPSILALAVVIGLAAVHLRGRWQLPVPAEGALALLLAGAAGFVVLARGSTLGPGTDIGMRLATYTRVIESGRSLTQSPFLVEPTPWEYSDAWHRLLGSAVRAPYASAGELLDLWHASGALTAVAAILAFALFAAEALPPPARTWATAAFAVALPFTRLAFTSGIGLALLWGGFGLALAAVRGRSYGLVAATALTAAGTAAIHSVEAYLLCAGLAVFGLLHGVRARSFKIMVAFLGLAALVAAASAPLIFAGHDLLLAQVSERAIVDPSDELLHLMAGVSIVHPRFWEIDPRSPFPWLALALLPLALRRGPEPARTLIAALLLVAVLGLLFPPSTLVVQELGLPSFLLARTGRLIPVALIIGAGLAGIAREGNRRLAEIALVAAMLAVVGWSASRPSWRRLVHEHPLLDLPARNLLEALPRGSVVLTDLWSADFVPAVGGHHAVAGITWHTGSTLDQVAARDFFQNPYQSSAETIDLLRRRRVDYVVHTDWARSAFDWPGYGGDFAPAEARDLLDANSAIFPRVGATDHIVVHAVKLGGVTTIAGKDRAPDFVLVDARARAGAPRIDGLELIEARRTPHGLGLTLAPAEAVRSSPLIAAVVTPPDFSETTVGDRIRRRLGGGTAGYASGFAAGSFRIDDRFYFARRLRSGERVELHLALKVPAHHTVWLGQERDLPRFPMPLGPALAAHFHSVPIAPVNRSLE